MKKSIKYDLLRYGSIAFGRYSGGATDTLLIYGLGVPVIPDSGTLKDAYILANMGIDVIVPDYIGYGRSDGKFTPKNCIKTFLKIYTGVREGIIGKNYYYDEEVLLKYERIIILGRSFGGAFVPLLSKYNKNIRELVLLFPAVDQKSQGEIKGEETNEQLMSSMQKDGYHHLYRGILDQIWWDNLENRDGLSPIDNLEYLDGTKLFIAHGKKDKCINYQKSVDYINDLKETNPKSASKYELRLYPKGEYGTSTSIPAMHDLLEWIKQGEY